MIELDKYKEFGQTILKGAKDTELPNISAIVTDLQNDYIDTITKHKSLEEENVLLKKSLQNMREQTMDLLLKQGTKVEGNTNQQQKQTEKSKFEDLFNDKGEII